MKCKSLKENQKIIYEGNWIILVPLGKEIKRDFVSSGERTQKKENSIRRRANDYN